MPGKNIKKRFRKSRKSLSKMVKSMVNKQLNKRSETKLVEVTDTLDSSVEITPGTPFVWSDIMPLGIAEGTGEEQRVGDEIELQSYQLRVRLGSGTIDCRMIAVYFPDSDGDSFEDLYTNDIPSFHPRKEATNERYKILFDRYYLGDTLPGGSGAGKIINYLNIKLPVKGLKVQYDSSATTINRGNIKFIILTNSGINANNTDYNAVAVLRWKDL